MHQCTRLWCTWPGTFHRQIPFKSTWFGPVVPSALSFKCIPWWHPPAKKWIYFTNIAPMHQMHQCTRLWCTWPGTFHKQIPFKSTWFGPVVPGAFRHQWSMTTHLIKNSNPTAESSLTRLDAKVKSHSSHILNTWGEYHLIFVLFKPRGIVLMYRINTCIMRLD